MADILSKLKILLPTRSKPKGSADSPTFDAPGKSETLSSPDYQEHLEDILDSRIADNSQELIVQLVKSDPDASSALNAYLTVAAVVPTVTVVDPDGVIDREGYKIANEIIEAMTVRRDYSKGYQAKKSLRNIAEQLRYMALVRGGVGIEAVFDEQLIPSELRIVDLASISWQETAPGIMIPWQENSEGVDVKLDIPTFFVEWYRKSPLEAYGSSAFIAAINTMAARQQIINDLYRIMQITGMPRMSIKVLEEVVIKNAPAEVRTDQLKLKTYMNSAMNNIRNQFSALRPDQPVLHWDSTEISMLNDKNPGLGVDIGPVIDVLNAQNQAGLRTMATVLGRGEAGVNTATVEAQLFAMNAGSLNDPIGDLLSAAFTMALRLQGSESRVIIAFPEVELRSDLELEANKTMRSQRLRSDLSDGLITDDEYHLQVHGRLRPDSIEELSGSGFADAKEGAVDAEGITPNSDPLGRSVSKATDKQSKSNSNKVKK